MDAAGRIGVKAGALGTDQHSLFDDIAPEWIERDVKNVTIEHKQAFGGAWLGLELCRALGLPEFFGQVMGRGRGQIPWPLMALVLVIGRLGDPSSELHLAEHSFATGALGKLHGVPVGKVNDDRLYRALDKLLPHKKALDKHLKEKLGELFSFDYDLLLYDVTSTSLLARSPA